MRTSQRIKRATTDYSAPSPVDEPVKRRRKTRACAKEGKVAEEKEEPAVKSRRRKTAERELATPSSSDSGSSKSKSKGQSKGSIESLLDVEARLEDLLGYDDMSDFDKYIDELESDTRSGVASLVTRAQEIRKQQEAELRRLEAMMEYENSILQARQCADGDEKPFFLIGVDEVGVGPLAGPIVSCAVAFQFPLSKQGLRLLSGINDSKKLSIAKRQALVEVIKKECITHSLGLVTAPEVDTLNPLQGSIEAMKRAVESLSLGRDATFHVLVDHHRIAGLGSDVQQTSITKGDAKSIVIAAASILAKVWRDEYMTRLHQDYPDFGFDRNAGYGTALHLAQLRKGNVCPEHRLSFEPVRLARLKALGLPATAPPKKTRSARKGSITLSTLEDKTEGLLHPSEEAPTDGKLTPEAIALATPAPPGILSVAYWTNWLLPASRPPVGSESAT